MKYFISIYSKDKDIYEEYVTQNKIDSIFCTIDFVNSVFCYIIDIDSEQALSLMLKFQPMGKLKLA